MKFRQWAWNVIVSGDMFLNAVLRGKPGQTISSRLADARAAGRLLGCVLCKVLDWFEQDHCELARHNDMRRASAVLDDLEDAGSTKYPPYQG